MKTTFLISALIAGSTAVAALAHGGATGIVKNRMDAMSNMGKVIKAVSPMMQGTAAYNADSVKRAAAFFAQHSGEAMTRMFPEGSGGKPSEARETIWSDWETFAGLAAQLGVAAQGLAVAADNGLMGDAAGTMSSDSMMGGGSTMMGSGSGMMGGGMMGGRMTVEQIGAMPADGAFAMVTQTCSACHTKFRLESK
ncbi:cytochrome c [Seohaeicola saemankumensis]|nr:cytochrome c [Seohaeicola saemankumensis]MCA0871411.1 cytochrome c [Seohaeicola saemankumensis]